MGRPISRWKAEETTFIFICLRLGVPLKGLAEYYNTSIANIYEVAKRNGMSANKLRLTPEQVKQHWESGALRFLF